MADGAGAARRRLQEVQAATKDWVLENLGDVQRMCESVTHLRMDRKEESMPTVRKKLAASKEYGKLQRRLERESDEEAKKEILLDLTRFRATTRIKVEEEIQEQGWLDYIKAKKPIKDIEYITYNGRRVDNREEWGEFFTEISRTKWWNEGHKWKEAEAREETRIKTAEKDTNSQDEGVGAYEEERNRKKAA